MVFITAGMGGGTGTGGAPVVAEVAKEMGILCVGVVTKPVLFEGKKRMDVADSGIENLSQYVDSLITIPNHRLQAVLGKVSMIEAFRAANNVLKNAVQGIADMILQPGVINVDFADVRTVMSEQGLAMMGTGSGKGDERARLATEMAIHSPLLDDIRLDGARGVLVSIAANEDLGLDEFTTVGEIVNQFASPEATVVIGTILDPDLGDELRVTVVATGLPKSARATGTAGMKLVSQPAAAAAQASRPEVAAATGTHGITADYDTPAYLRNQKVANGGTTARQADVNLLNIPAFLRRQAD
jgi:cell division protein FtsZ